MQPYLMVITPTCSPLVSVPSVLLSSSGKHEAKLKM
jgi:hypothetical protein